MLGLLEKLNKIKPVWVELGLQTIHEKSADYIRRMYPLSVYDSATENLHKIGINVITHIILGLPNESKEMMLESVKYAGSKTDGIKLQLLHVLKTQTCVMTMKAENLMCFQWKIILIFFAIALKCCLKML